MTKVYRYHRCHDRHTTWPAIAACIWPHATIDGDGQFAAVTCGARAIVLVATLDQAQARKRSLDRDGCRPGCYRRHRAVALVADPEPMTVRMAKRWAIKSPDPGPPRPPKPDKPICGRPRTNGQPCQRPPGWGADPGELRCKDHGGATVQRTAEKERAVDEALAYANKVETTRTSLLAAAKLLEADATAEAAGLPFCGLVPEVPGSASRLLGLTAEVVVVKAEGR